MVQLRQGPSGPPIVGDNIGDILIWDGIEWVPGPQSGGGTTAWDHIVETLADLPAPVAGVITLTDGSWAFKAAIDVGANVVLVPTGTTVLLKGMGGFNEKVLSGDDVAVLDVQGSAYLESLSVRATAGVPLLLTVNAAVVSSECYFNSDGLQGVVLEAGLWRDSQSRVSGGTEGLDMSGGSCHLVNTHIVGGTEPAMSVSGTVTRARLTACRLSANNTECLTWEPTEGELSVVDTDLVCSSTGSAVALVQLATAVQFIGGSWTGDTGAGLLIDGNITRLLQVEGVAGYALSSMVEYSSGAVRQATIQGCSSFSDVAVGVTWAAANIPNNGLAMVGNTFDTATPIAGFTAASARVNSKANVSLGALMQETAIVP